MTEHVSLAPVLSDLRTAPETLPVAGVAAISRQPLAPAQAYGIVFIASACTMVIEILAGRLMAPHLGVSLYTWTSIIGVVLAGMTLGNFAGGWLADKRASRLILSRFFLAAAGTCLLLVSISNAVFVVVANLDVPVMARIILAATIIFFVPSFLLGTTTPQVVKLTLSSLDEVGRTIGTIYAMSAFGSIVGSFLAGFVLVDYVGTLRTLLLLTAILFACGIVVRARLQRATAVFVVLFLVGTAGGASANVFNGPCVEETGYFCVRLREQTEPDGAVTTMLILDRLVHTAIRLDDPGYLGYGYEDVYRRLTEAHLADPAAKPDPLLVVGGGGYAFPRFMGAAYPEVPVEVVEIDPGVVAFNHDRLGLPEDTPIVSHAEDARTFFRNQAAAATYGIVQIDVFNDVSVPYHLTTVEFLRSVRASMTADGLLMTNLIDAPDSGLFVQAYANTLQQVFPHVGLYAIDLKRPRMTYVVVGSAEPVNLAVAGWTRLSADEFAASCPKQIDLVLTDDFAPTDRLLRPVMEQAR